MGEEKIELEKYLHKNIPISKAMGIEVFTASKDKVILKAPFAKNINHKKTVFGGSLHAVATLSCWCWLHLHLKTLNPLDIVITNSNVDYRAPVVADFEARCMQPEEDAWRQFTAMLQAKGKARIVLHAEIVQSGKLAVAFTGTFAAIKRSFF